MSTKAVFAIAALVCALLWAGAEWTLPHEQPGKTVLRWATDANPARREQISKFQELNPDVEVRLESGDMSKMIVQCSTGTGPDLIDVLSVQDMSRMVDAGILLDLTPEAAKNGFAPEKTYPSMRDGLFYKGRMYRFPCNVGASCIIYNKAVFADHGLPEPQPGWTWEDFVKICQQLRDIPSRSGQKHFPFANWNGLIYYYELFCGTGGRFFKDGGLRCNLDSPQAIDALQRYYDLIYKYKVVPTPAEASGISSQGGWGSGGFNWFSEGRAAMIPIARWYIVQLPYYPELQGKLGAIQMPSINGRPSASRVECRGSGINALSRHKPAALRFLNFLASEDYSKLIAAGGDSLPPIPEYGTPEKLVCKYEPNVAFHRPFVEAMRDGYTPDVSPYIENSLVIRWLQEAINRVENNLQQPDEALRALAAEVDQRIARNLAYSKNLQAEYEANTGRTYSSNWQSARPALPLAPGK